MNPYFKLVSSIDEGIYRARNLPMGRLEPAPQPDLPEDAARVLLFSPHPDDECITGGLPLRLMREAKMRVVDVAVTQGSNRARQPARWQELCDACNFIGFEPLATREGGLENIKREARRTERAAWEHATAIIKGILNEQQPEIIFLPHEHDWNSTHIGTHLLIVDALRELENFSCLVIETEFWSAMDDPNLMVESSVQDVADLVGAISFHVGEVERNPYHLTLPAWMQNNVRRGSELVGGQGGTTPEFTFATLYRARRWLNGDWVTPSPSGRFIPCESDLRKDLNL